MSDIKALIISQVLTQDYYDLIKDALGYGVQIDLITGSNIKDDKIENNIIKSPCHNPSSIKSRFICWLQYLWFIKKCMRNRKEKSYDLIYATSNPPINSYIGLKLKKKFRAPFIYMNWDIYPQIIEKSISSLIVSFLCAIWKRWNQKNYPKIDNILTIGYKMAENIKIATKSEIKIDIIPLGIDEKRIRPIKKSDNKFLLVNEIEDKFIVLFSGKMGEGHNIEIILNAAKRLKGIKEIIFVFIGNGSKYKVIEDFLDAYDGDNVLLFPWQDEKMYPHSIACGDIAIITEEKVAEGLMLPSRLFSMMSCEEAIIGICSKNDDLYEIIESNNVGICITNNSEKKLADTIMEWYENEKKLNEKRIQARKLIKKEYSIDKVTIKYRKLFREYIYR